MMELQQSVCFTGHRTLYEERDVLTEKVKECLRELSKKGVTCCYCGGAVGFDLLCGEAVLELEKECGFHLVMAVPYPGQERSYSAEEKARYIRLVSASEVVVVSPQYHRYSLMQRNQYLVDHAAYCICNLRRESGGTFQTREYAKMRGRQILEL